VTSQVRGMGEVVEAVIVVEGGKMREKTSQR